MIVWRGYGILVIVLGALGLLGSQLVAEAIFGGPPPSEFVPIGQIAGMWLGAVLVALANLALERVDKPRTVIDKETGSELVLKAKHDFFFIPMKYWAYLLMLIGVARYFAN